MPMVAVEWRDACSLASSAWVTIDELETGHRTVSTVGYWVQGVNPGELVVAQSYDAASERWDHVVSIPFGMVRRITALVSGASLPIEPG